MKGSNMMLLGLMLLLVASFSASAAENNASKLMVQGEGKVSAAPDMVTIVLGVETHNASAAGAAAENARLMNETINALLDANIATKDIQTSRYSLTMAPQEEPKTASDTQKPPEFIATNQVTVRLNDTSAVGKVLDAAVAAGSNSIQEVTFDLRNPQPEKDQALALAIKDAGRKADIAAAAAGVKLGKVLEISEGYGSISSAARSKAFFDTATSIQPGEMEITASVSVTYEVF